MVGGGHVAARKIAGLLECGGNVTVVARKTGPEVEALLTTHAPPRLDLLRRAYESSDIAGCRLVMTATGDPEVDRTVYADGEAAGVSVNGADEVEACRFFVPAVLREGPIGVAVSTGGASPYLAGWVRDRVRSVLGPEVGALAALVAGARERVRAAGVATEGLAWAELVDGRLWPILTEDGPDASARAGAAADAWVAEQLRGAGG